ncbi:hypothetical protein Zmor_026066 [Zophobas morio]|uniref:Uncharacterized protein n=1 Tax=Zophobas morio TaxID=2755281 RepID=A0AA38HSW6_9CUCU|nr:hypothetical protein Zmor_026066 [Zophobas morio]
MTLVRWSVLACAIDCSSFDVSKSDNDISSRQDFIQVDDFSIMERLQRPKGKRQSLDSYQSIPSQRTRVPRLLSVSNGKGQVTNRFPNSPRLDGGRIFPGRIRRPVYLHVPCKTARTSTARD